MSYEGMDELEICPETGDLLVSTPGATLRDSAPLTYQDDGARRVTVPSAFRLLGDGQVAFELGDYDNRIPLVIDPGMLFCTFLGEGGNDVGNDVAIDTDGCAYVAGLTTSSKFPLTPGAYDTRFDTSEAFVSKFSKNGTSLVYSTFIGGLLDEEATGVAVDDDGLVYLVGTTGSSNFPTTAGAFCTTLSGSVDAFALKDRDAQDDGGASVKEDGLIWWIDVAAGDFGEIAKRRNAICSGYRDDDFFDVIDAVEVTGWFDNDGLATHIDLTTGQNDVLLLQGLNHNAWTDTEFSKLGIRQLEEHPLILNAKQLNAPDALQ